MKYAIIVAGGAGTRLGGDMPKQFRTLGNLPMLAHSLFRFYEQDKETHIILVLPKEQFSIWESLKSEFSISIPHRVVAGGKERFFSVKNALDTITGEKGVVAIHDAARPFVSTLLIEDTFRLAEQQGSAVPVVEVPYSLRKLEKGRWIAADRADYRIVQTPQVFDLSKLKEAYTQSFTTPFTDDASVYEAAGFKVELAKGESRNIKVTTAEDMEIAAFLMAGRTS